MRLQDTPVLQGLKSLYQPLPIQAYQLIGLIKVVMDLQPTL